MNRLIFSAFAAALVFSTPMQAAEDAAAKGARIALEAEKRDSGWRDSQVTLTMILKDRKGRSRERKLHISSLEVSSGKLGDKSLVVFDSPADLKGTILLSHAKLGADDDQWLYLPGLKRVKRISSSKKTSAFFGSEFAYEDITATEFGKYKYNYVGQKPCASLTCFVVERRPAYKNSGYSVLVTYYDTAQYRPQIIEYFDRKGRPFKVLTMSGYKKYAGRFWRARTFTMRNLKTGKSSILKYGSYKFNTGLNDSYFSQGNLRNVQ
ncbi:MAG: outer membrane lipoprotein-sorting protein [Alphaproteobacteria bacterium]|nr:outer membrane lipoprotein-sorting protein [Alphaproteobacteria bacterium]